MSEWPTVRFEELADSSKSAFSKPYGSAILKEDYLPQGVPVVRGVNLRNGIFVDDGFVFISDRKADQMPGANLTSGDLVFTHRGTIGQVSMIPRERRYPRYVLSTSHVKARLDASRALPEFYYYYFSSPVGQQELLKNISTVGVPGLAQPVATIKSLTVPHPPLSVQKNTMEVLGVLDDKIAANERIAATALTLADTLFEEIVNGLPFGPESFGTVASVYGGGTPSTSEPSYWDGGIAWATPTDVTALSAPYLFRTNRTITDAGLSNCASQLYPSGSIFMTSRATIGAFAVPQLPAAVNQGFIVVIPPSRESRWWLFHEMRSQMGEMLSLANGSTFLELSRKNFKAMPVRIASQEVLVQFDAKVAPLHQRAAATAQESSVLSELRDALLPRLMSGEIRVRDAEKVVEGVT
jgi:type I restriction enzyme, S subunit